MNFLKWAGIAVVLTVVQTSLSAAWRVWLFTPDLLLLGIILIAVYTDGDEIFLFAPVLGYVRDLYSGGVAGTSLLVFFLMVYFIRNEKRRLDFDSYLLDLMVAAGTFFDGLTAFFLQQLAADRDLNWPFALFMIAGRAAYNVAVVEAARFLWKKALERRFLAPRAARRRFKET